MEGQPTRWETVFANHTSDERHVLKQKIAATTLATKLKKKNDPVQKHGKRIWISIYPMKIHKIPVST